jgi:hypothetical protein
MKFANVNGEGRGTREGAIQCISLAGSRRTDIAVSLNLSLGGWKSLMMSSSSPGLQRTVAWWRSEN